MSIPLGKWALCHDGEEGGGVMLCDDDHKLHRGFTSVLKGTQDVPITSCVQMTFYRVDEHFVLRKVDITRIL